MPTGKSLRDGLRVPPLPLLRISLVVKYLLPSSVSPEGVLAWERDISNYNGLRLCLSVIR